MKKLLLVSALLLAAVLALATGVKEEAHGVWKPTKPITIIVPWGAGGSTDQITRVTAGELETALGQKIVIVNQGGAAGSVGTKSVMDAVQDGYTWASGAAQDLGSYRVLGLLDTDLNDWTLFLSVANVSVVAVNANTPYKTFDDLLKAFKEKPGQVTVATAGQTSAGHNAIENIRKYTKIEYKHVTYDGGNPAVIGTVSGESEVTTQLAVEEADMLRAGKLRALAVLAEKDLELRGYGTIPSINKWIPELKTAPNYFGVWVTKKVPQEVVDTLADLWQKVVMNSQKIKDYALDRGAIFDPSFGDAAKKKVFPVVQMNTWLLYDAGKAKVAPDSVGIPRP